MKAQRFSNPRHERLAGIVNKAVAPAFFVTVTRDSFDKRSLIGAPFPIPRCTGTPATVHSLGDSVPRDLRIK